MVRSNDVVDGGAGVMEDIMDEMRELEEKGRIAEELVAVEKKNGRSCTKPGCKRVVHKVKDNPDGLCAPCLMEKNLERCRDEKVGCTEFGCRRAISRLNPDSGLCSVHLRKKTTIERHGTFPIRHAVSKRGVGRQEKRVERVAETELKCVVTGLPFGQYPGLYEKLETMAHEQVRTIPEQIMFFLKVILEIDTVE